MRTMLSSVVAIGIGAAAYSMSGKKNKKKVQSFLRPITAFELDSILNKKKMKKTKKQLSNLF